MWDIVEVVCGVKQYYETSLETLKRTIHNAPNPKQKMVTELIAIGWICVSVDRSDMFGEIVVAV